MNTQTKLPEPKEPRVKPVSGFMTTDGKLFDHRPDAEAYQNRLDFFGWCQESICRGGEWSATMVAEAIWQQFNVTPRDGV